jgi:hypothetical protein
MTSVYPAGVPDLLIIRDGLALFIEVKRPGGKVSPVQEVVHLQIRRRGIPVLVVTSLTELQSQLENL